MSNDTVTVGALRDILDRWVRDGVVALDWPVLAQDDDTEMIVHDLVVSQDDGPSAVVLHTVWSRPAVRQW